VSGAAWAGVAGPGGAVVLSRAGSRSAVPSSR
jgi:hypothetical protein